MSDSSRLSKIIPFSIIGIVSAIAIIVMIALTPVTTQVSAAQSTPVHPDIYLGSVELMGVKSISGEDVLFGLPDFAQTYTIKNDQTCTGIEINIIMKDHLEDPMNYQCSVKITDPSGNVALNIPRDSSGWSSINVIDNLYTIQHEAELTFTQGGTWTIEVELWYYT